jgi:hypothetical protein
MRWLRRSRTPLRPRYEKRFEEPRPINVPDWELLEEVEALFGLDSEGRPGPYSALGHTVQIYNIATVADLRAKVEERGAPLWAIRILKRMDDPKGGNELYVRMYLTTRSRREVIVSGDAEDEVSVDDMTTRLAELVARAADRSTAQPPLS